MISIIENVFSSLASNFILLLINPLGLFMIMASLLYLEKIIIKSIKDGGPYNHAIRLKIREIV